jgi:hypothetical protein
VLDKPKSNETVLERFHPRSSRPRASGLRCVHQRREGRLHGHRLRLPLADHDWLGPDREADGHPFPEPDPFGRRRRPHPILLPPEEHLAHLLEPVREPTVQDGALEGPRRPFLVLLRAAAFSGEDKIGLRNTTRWRSTFSTSRATIFRVCKSTSQETTPSRTSCIVDTRGENGRFFRSFTATRFDGIWILQTTSESNPFANKGTISVPQTKDISQADVIRRNWDRMFSLDESSLQLVDRRYDPGAFETDVALLPYQPASLPVLFIFTFVFTTSPTTLLSTTWVKTMTITRTITNT